MSIHASSTCTTLLLKSAVLTSTQTLSHCKSIDLRVYFIFLYFINIYVLVNKRSEEKKSLLSVKLLPKKAARTLRNTLEALHEKIYLTFWSERGKRPEDPDASLDRDFKVKKKEVLI